MKILIRILSIIVLSYTSVFSQGCKSHVNITTDDPLSLIYIDANFVGKGRADLDVDKGIHPIIIRESLTKWNGYEIYDSINVKNCGEVYSFPFKTKNSKSLSNNKTDINYKPEVEIKDFTDSKLFTILISSATVLGITAAYFKLQADKKYDNYTSDKKNATLNEVHRLDTYSGIALGLLQINIGYLIYRILTD